MVRQPYPKPDVDGVARLQKKLPQANIRPSEVDHPASRGRTNSILLHREATRYVRSVCRDCHASLLMA